MRSSILDLGLGVLLDADPRPSFIVDISTKPPSVVYTSTALASHGSLRGIVNPLTQQNAELWEWISRLSRERRSHLTFSFAGVLWTVTVLQTWLVISANEQAPSADLPQKHAADTTTDAVPLAPPVNSISANTALTSARDSSSDSSGISTPKPAVRTSGLQPPSLVDRRANSTPGEILPSVAAAITPIEVPVSETLRRATTDPGWIVPDIVPEQRPFLDVINSVDWAATPLGPMSEWTPRLQQIVNQILADSRAIAIYWGEHYSTIYNEAFSKLCGSKHPFLLGRPVEETWPEGAAALKEAMRISAEKQRASTEDEWRHFVENGLDDDLEESRWLEEVYLKWSVVPLYDEDNCLGFMHPVVETTSMRLWERRMKMLIELGEMLVTPRDVKSYWGTIIDRLEAVEPRYDIPLAILYSVDDDPNTQPDGTRKYASTKICHLEGSLGVPEGHPIIPQTLPLWSSDDGLSAVFREALAAPQHPLVIEMEDLPKSLMDGLHWRGFGDPCRAAVVLPIRPTKEEMVMGLMVLGINPRRPYDNDYRQYISLLSQKITTSLASTVLLEEEARRGRNMAEQAAYDQAMLKEKLAAQTKEATESIQKFEAVAEFIPVGMCFGDNQGNITFANDAFCRITGLTREGLLPNQGYLPCVVEQDREIVASAYDDLQTRQSVTFEFRVKPHDLGDLPTPPTRSSPSFERAGLEFVTLNKQTERHVLASAKAERAPDGTIVRLLTCLTDVTLHKQTAEEAVRRAQQAENLKRMAEFATVGMYDMDLQGRLLGANNVFFEMCGMKVVDPTVVEIKPWEECIYEDDYPMLREKLKSMVAEGKVQNVEVRFKNAWAAEDGAGNSIKAPRWVQATLMPVQDSEGVIKSFTGCLSDVSLQKWQLEREKERKEEAIESKRQQENFIDMTSHEMRNPLSAIIHCADAVTATLTKAKELVPAQASAPKLAVNGDVQPQQQEETADIYSEEQELIDSCIENAEIIVTCAQHQKRIVDDILTMSKLDSQLLAITPVTVNTIEVVQEALKMFEVEARRVDIALDMIVDQSYHDLGMTYLEFDPSRLKQVLINLLTNALKFTKTGPTRSVTVTMSASRNRPTDANSKVQFIPRARELDDEDSSPNERRDDASPIWLIFEVKDTGQGLTEDEMKSLFQRFVQASSRTHVKYGGSGLGLFISRRLTELQNGAIGVASSPGVGSTFAFYIEAHVPSEAAVKEAAEAAAAARQFAASTVLAPLTRSSRLGPATTERGTPNTSSRNSPALSGLPRPPPTTSKVAQSSHAQSSEIEGVLIVEDNIINQHITRRGLNDYYRTDVANHGIEALEKVRNSDRYIDLPHDKQPTPSSPPSSPLPSPVLERTTSSSATKSTPNRKENSGKFPLSVILMDIEMPIQDGLTCTRHIREMEAQGRIRGGRIPIIAVSANARAEQVQEARAAGCDGVLVKPFRMHELIAKMEGVVRDVAGRTT
ncbi:Peroxide stress-activated histidine kinase mak1 [Coniochaeta hoffmannii]|uniref:Peroxide stress-activated histidine kinase mak1 n=1 Tax=Coniochaeta hoffmannii TaxID=91930 RepID=A0AA38RDK4_9PEZI|nr:Peroxide stress-activated histidine kinase mak1 [Coniochaeta hoffmannii]